MCLAISLYALRGYVLYYGRGDIASYVGQVKDIITYGYTNNNIYPISAILISQICQLTNISVIGISKYLPSLFFTIYVLSIYCWSKSLIPDKKFVLLSLIASTPIFFAGFSTSIFNELLAVLTLPLFFHCLQKSPDIRFKILCIIMLLLYPFFHPMVAIFVFFYLAVIFIQENTSCLLYTS